MSNRVGRYVDAEALVVGWLRWSLPLVRVVTSVPNPIPAEGVLWVAGVGGPADYDNSTPRIDLQTLVPGVFGAATALTGQGHEAMGALGDEESFNGHKVHSVHCISLPVRRYWSDEIDRLAATYQLNLPTFL